MAKDIKKYLGMSVLALLGINVAMALFGMANTSLAFLTSIITFGVVLYYTYDSNKFKLGVQDLILFGILVLAFIGLNSTSGWFNSIKMGFLFSGISASIIGMAGASVVVLIIGLLRYLTK